MVPRTKDAIEEQARETISRVVDGRRRDARFASAHGALVRVAGAWQAGTMVSRGRDDKFRRRSASNQDTRTRHPGGIHTRSRTTRRVDARRPRVALGDVDDGFVQRVDLRRSPSWPSVEQRPTVHLSRQKRLHQRTDALFEGSRHERVEDVDGTRAERRDDRLNSLRTLECGENHHRSLHPSRLDR